MSETLLICTLINNPNLARHLKVVSIEEKKARFGSRAYSSFSRLREQYADKIISVIMQYIGVVGKEDFREILSDGQDRPIQEMAENWIKRLQSAEQFDFALSILLLLLPNLEELHIHLYGFDSALVLCLLSIASRLQRSQTQKETVSFPRLKVVAIRKELYVGSRLRLDIPLGRLAPILSMPSLQSFSCCKIGSTPDLSFTHETAIQSLSLLECDFLPQEIEPIVLKLASLRSIKIQLSDIEPAGIPERGTWPRFVEALAHLHGSLKYLSLRDSCTAYRSTFQRLPSLHQFRKLTFLEIEADFLEDVALPLDRSDPVLPANHKVSFYDFTTFPSSLEHLIINNDGAISAIDHLQYNIRNLPFPALKAILVELRFNELTSDFEAARELSRRYREHGVMLIIKYYEQRQDEEDQWFCYIWTVWASRSGLKNDEILGVRAG